MTANDFSVLLGQLIRSAVEEHPIEIVYGVLHAHTEGVRAQFCAFVCDPNSRRVSNLSDFKGTPQ